MKQISTLRFDKGLYALTAGLGITVWVAPWLLLDGKEAWDHWTYFAISLPLMSVVTAYAGYRSRTRWWRWPVALTVAQLVTMVLLEGFGNLLPLGLIAFAILAVPMSITAAICAWIAKRRELE